MWMYHVQERNALDYVNGHADNTPNLLCGMFHLPTPTVDLPFHSICFAVATFRVRPTNFGAFSTRTKLIRRIDKSIVKKKSLYWNSMK